MAIPKEWKDAKLNARGERVVVMDGEEVILARTTPYLPFLLEVPLHEHTFSEPPISKEMPNDLNAPVPRKKSHH